MSAQAAIRVLHLDDDQLDAELIHERLRSGQPGRWEFVHVTGREGFESELTREGFDLVIMDHNIPGYDGMVALQEAHRRLPGTPIIIISGSLTEEDAVNCLKAGATDYVLKQRMQRLKVAADRALAEAEERRKRVRAETELQEVAQRFRELASNSRDVFWFMSVEPELMLYISPAMEAIWGRPASEFYGDPRAWAASVHEEDRGRVDEAFGRWIGGAAERFDEQYRVVRPDGSARWVHDTGTRIRDESGRVVRVSGIARDITRRRQAEEELRVLNMELEQRVMDRTTELRAANRELEAFSFSVSHDLRAPLRAVSGFTALLKADYADQLDETARQFIDRIHTGCERMDGLIDDILALALISRADLIAADADLTTLAEKVIAELRERDPGRQVETAVEQGLHVHADARLLRVALDNLIGNAWKFSSRRELARIEVGLSNASGMLSTYFVRDNGVGFDPKYSERLFSPFQRLHSDGEFPGTGIGLATVRRVIERHGGNVWAESQPDRGATFFFSLPKRPG
jgi:PAS domain S-box-containing protein